MGLSLQIELLFAYLQQLPAFRCIDLQCVEEGDHLYVRATVGSAWDRSRLVQGLEKTLDGQSFTHMIQIDSLLNTPFSPTLPFNEAKDVPPETLVHRFLLGGERLTAAPSESN